MILLLLLCVCIEVMLEVCVVPTASIGSSTLMTSFTPDQGLQEDSIKPPKRPKIEGLSTTMSNHSLFVSIHDVIWLSLNLSYTEVTLGDPQIITVHVTVTYSVLCHNDTLLMCLTLFAATLQQ